MATDATGTPTAKGIPTYNPDVDAPSGLGFNAAMAAIDALLDSYVNKPASIATGEVPVWNGSAWVRSSATNIGPGSLGSGSPSSANFLRGDGTWASVGGATLVTALPGSPSDGDEVIFVDSTSAPTYQWRLRYVAAKASNKWIYLGGTPLQAVVTTSQSTMSGTYTDLGTVGPSVTVPVTGDYNVTIGAVSGGNEGWMSYAIGGSGAVDADGASDYASSPVFKIARKAALTATTALVMKYRATSGTPSWADRRIAIEPSAIGG